MKFPKKSSNGTDSTALTDKALAQSVAVSVAGIILCMVLLSAATWAWFSKDVSSTANVLQSANYDVNVAVTYTDGENNTLNVDASSNPCSFTLTKGIKYTVTLSSSGNASTGYCAISLNGNLYYTTQIAKDGELFFYVDCTDQNDPDNITLDITDKWGTSSYYANDQEDVLVVADEILVATGN